MRCDCSRKALYYCDVCGAKTCDECACDCAPVDEPGPFDLVTLLTPQPYPSRSEVGDVCRVIMPLPNHKWMIENKRTKEQLTVGALDIELIGAENGR
jgi:hypothetical protein